MAPLIKEFENLARLRRRCWRWSNEWPMAHVLLVKVAHVREVHDLEEEELDPFWRIAPPERLSMSLYAVSSILQRLVLNANGKT